jgi:hypothetical protein
MQSGVSMMVAMDEDGVGVKVEGTLRNHFPSETQTWGISLRLACTSPTLPNHPADHQHNRSGLLNCDTRDDIEKGAVGISKLPTNSLQIYKNRRANIFLHWRILHEPLCQSPTTASGIQVCKPQDRSMAEPISSEVIDARIKDPV